MCGFFGRLVDPLNVVDVLDVSPDVPLSGGDIVFAKVLPSCDKPLMHMGHGLSGLVRMAVG